MGKKDPGEPDFGLRAHATNVWPSGLWARMWWGRDLPALALQRRDCWLPSTDAAVWFCTLPTSVPELMFGISKEREAVRSFPSN